MSQDFWLGVLAIPVFTAAGVALFYAVIGARFLAEQAFGKILRYYSPIRYGGPYATDYGVRSTFAAIALTSRRMWLFEPFKGFAVFIMLSRPSEHTRTTLKLKADIENAYDKRLGEES